MNYLSLACIAMILCTISGCGGNSGTQTAQPPVITAADTTAPTFTSFKMPATATSLNVAVTSFEANDNVACTGYMIKETNTPPLADDAGWSATEQTTFTFSSAGTKTAYAWAKDAAGNISAAATADVTITVTDTTPPVNAGTDITPPTITSFTLVAPATTATTNVATVTFTATDNVGVTGFMIKEVNSPPLAGDAGWTATAPTTFSFPSASPKPVYGWAKDAAGNVSQGAQATITIQP